MSDHEFLRVAVVDGIATITLNRPPVNVLNIPMMRELGTVLGSELDHDALAAIVFRADGKAFSAGVDVADHTGAKAAEMIRLFHGIFRRLAATDALTIAVVGRAALGGGCELACFCDIVLASDRAKFGQPEVQVGVLPPVAACFLPAQVGIKKAIELAALGGTIDAAEAHRIGLVNQVYPDEAFASEVDAFLAGLKKLSRPVVRLAKRTTALQVREALLAQLDRVEAIYLEELMRLKDAHEGIAAFLEKRAPIWKHG